VFAVASNLLSCIGFIQKLVNPSFLQVVIYSIRMIVCSIHSVILVRTV